MKKNKYAAFGPPRPTRKIFIDSPPVSAPPPFQIGQAVTVTSRLRVGFRGVVTSASRHSTVVRGRGAIELQRVTVLFPDGVDMEYDYSEIKADP